MRQCTWGGAGATLASLLCASVAQAGTVSVVWTPAGSPTVRYIGAAGESSDGAINNGFDGTRYVVGITDRPLSVKLDASADAACSLTLTGASCKFGRGGPQPVAYADLRDGADAFDVSTSLSRDVPGAYALTEVQGGGGNDALNASSSGPILRGGTGADRFTLDNANPYATGACPACPPGSEPPSGVTIGTVSYQDHPNGVTVTVDEAANEGYPGEGDFVEPGLNVLGSQGPDTMSNGAASHSWFGFLDGAGGNDVIEGEGQDGPLRGGDGADRISSRDWYRDAVDCGAGPDVLVTDPFDTHTGCETVDVAEASR